ncbi:hypothetical protein, partial [Klebsiella pneumoniae]|uniref:hypothetical protein n=1 Tax=Klebsiella pneumoniae TaxID=573 RepID=UPI003B984F2E
ELKRHEMSSHSQGDNYQRSQNIDRDHRSASIPSVSKGTADETNHHASNLPARRYESSFRTT